MAVLKGAEGGVNIPAYLRELADEIEAANDVSKWEIVRKPESIVEEVGDGFISRQKTVSFTVRYKEWIESYSADELDN